jgi:hypothetical protein
VSEAQHQERRQPLEAQALDERPVGVAPHEPAIDGVAEMRLAIAFVDGMHTMQRTSLSPNVAKMRSTTGTNARTSGRSGNTITAMLKTVVQSSSVRVHALVARDLEQRIGVLGHDGER